MKKIGIILSAIGLILLFIAGLVVYNHQKFMSSAKLGKGTITDLEYQRSSDKKSSGTYHPVVTYTTQEGKEYTIHSNSGSNPPSYTKGEKVDIYYNPKDPNDVSMPDFFSQWGGGVITGGIGLIPTLIGFGILFAQRSRTKTITWLRQFGTSVQADFEQVTLNESLSVNGKHPFHILCTWLDPGTNTIYSFKSENLWFDPSPYIQQKKLTVLIDPQNPAKKNYVDISFLPKQG
jgi:Protein of unknown function (DUF3592)